jgi:hypothetical protein
MATEGQATSDGPSLSRDDLYRAVGSIAAATTLLEFALAGAVSSLTQSPLTSILVQGERASTLTRMCRRLVEDGIGSTAHDEKSGRTSRLGLLSFADTQAFLAILKQVDALIGERDHVVHSIWLPSDAEDTFLGQKITRSTRDSREWTLEKLERLRQNIVNAQVDVFIAAWNATADASGMPRTPIRVGDAIG